MGGNTLKNIIGVRFRRLGKIYFFNPQYLIIKKGEYVIVETSDGEEIAQVVIPNRKMPDEKVIAPLKKVIRIANPKDMKHYEACKKKEKEAFEFCVKKIKECVELDSKAFSTFHRWIHILNLHCQSDQSIASFRQCFSRE